LFHIFEYIYLIVTIVYKIKSSEEIRVLLATDVLSEGQNLQDSFIVVNYDLPWAIIRLVQRAGRVDRIGQKSEKILCYSFKPADGIERIINLRKRLLTRLGENAEVVGTDEEFFPDQESKELINLYTTITLLRAVTIIF
jgi:superfamily II DNA/RNA helicase